MLIAPLAGTCEATANAIVASGTPTNLAPPRVEVEAELRVMPVGGKGGTFRDELEVDVHTRRDARCVPPVAIPGDLRRRALGAPMATQSLATGDSRWSLSLMVETRDT